MIQSNRLLTSLAGLFLCLALFCLPARAQRSTGRAQGSTGIDVAASPFSPAPYQIGERLTYNVSFSNFPTAAHVELFVARRGTFFGHEGIELRAHVETIGVVNVALYALDTDYIAYVDPSTGLPFRTQQVARSGAATVGARPSNISRDYSLPAGTSALPTKVTAAGPIGAYDFLSALFRLRALPLTPSSAYRFNVQNDTASYEADLMVTGQELIKTNIGSFNAIATQVLVPRNLALNNYRVRIYFSDDDRHLPLLLTARHPAGEIRVEIASSELPNAPPPSVAPATPPVVAASPPRRVPISPSTGTDAEDDPVEAPSTVGLPFQPGEQLNFTFYLGSAGRAIGTASYQVRSRAKYFNHEGFLLTSTLQTNGSQGQSFPVNDQINSYIDATTLLPFRTELHLLEGRRRANWTINIDQDRGKAEMGDGTSIAIPTGTYDLVSILYALRSFDLTPPKHNAVSLLLNKHPTTLSITSLRREFIEIGKQRIPAIQLSLATDGPGGDRFGIRLWVSADRRHLPLRVSANTPLGPVRADLAIIPLDVQ